MRKKSSLSLHLILLVMLLMSSVSCTHTLVKQGDFPPCVKASPAEIQAIQNLEDQNIIALLGRIGQWCMAYHERIGY